MIYQLTDIEGNVSMMVVDRVVLRGAMVIKYHEDHLPNLKRIAKAMGCPQIIYVAVTRTEKLNGE